ncbi:hypothetical protein [Crateriforma conspicua]|uniref:Uncharacterized protein n=1 Tax=Crateriforma conspicua TaxID=2527996 RepID=A0A5C6FMX2_9PLAN|nr:hypothetical protein [Crateriforma conspicua]TWU63465.1 hypothetical protein V7x_52050 [Crateriforma conspicua]
MYLMERARSGFSIQFFWSGSDPELLTRLGICTLMIATVAIALEFCAATVGPVPLSIRLFGLAIGFYGFATLTFRFSRFTEIAWCEAVLFFGLPAYLLCVRGALVRCFALLSTVYFLISPRPVD